VKSERELRAFLAMCEEAYQLQADCHRCKDCYALAVQIRFLKWILNGDSDFDRQVEEFAAALAESR